MPYNPGRSGDITSVDELRQFVQDELEKISKELNETIALDLRTVHQEPKRPRDGMLVAADGSDWNPGAGPGTYEYVGGVWRRVAGLEAGDYGDVTVDGSGNIAIDNDVVTYAKMQELLPAAVIGRGTAGLGNPERIPAGNGIAIDATSIRTAQQMSVTVDGSGLKLSGDATSPGNLKKYGTDGSGTKGWFDDISIGRKAVESVGAGTTYTRAVSAGAKLIAVHLLRQSHNGGAAQNLQIELSDDNASSWSTPVVVTSATFAAASSIHGMVFLGHDGGFSYWVTTGFVSGIGGLAAMAAEITHYRLSWSGGASFDLGNVITWEFA